MVVDTAMLDLYTVSIVAAVLVGGIIGHRYIQASLKGMLIGAFIPAAVLTVFSVEWLAFIGELAHSNLYTFLVIP